MGWANNLENLASAVETGIDRRVARRPMMGLIPGPAITSANTAEYNLAESTTGNLLLGVAPEMGAASAGLQDGDVIFSLSGNRINQAVDYRHALVGKHAGDVVEVIYYRDMVTLISLLPDQFVNRKVPYHVVVGEIPQIGWHLQMHADQIRATIAQRRGSRTCGRPKS